MIDQLTGDAPHDPAAARRDLTLGWVGRMFPGSYVGPGYSPGEAEARISLPRGGGGTVRTWGDGGHVHIELQGIPRTVALLILAEAAKAQR